MRVLSIGNSFSQDAHHYLTALCKHNGFPMKAVNLLIGGCSLETHYTNMLDDVSAYSFSAFDIPVSEEERRIAISAVSEAIPGAIL